MSELTSLRGDLAALRREVRNIKTKQLASGLLVAQADIVTLDGRLDVLEDGSAGVFDYRPEMVRGRTSNSSTNAISSGSYGNILQVGLAIPSDWVSYDVEAYASGYFADASGGSTGTAVLLTKVVHQGGDFDSGPSTHEMEAQNNHDINNWSMIAYVEGLGAVGSTRLFTLQAQISSGNATSLSRPILIVAAYRTS